MFYDIVLTHAGWWIVPLFSAPGPGTSTAYFIELIPAQKEVCHIHSAGFVYKDRLVLHFRSFISLHRLNLFHLQ